jgi:hypothetical protein
MVIHVSELSNPILVGIREGLHIIYLIMSVSVAPEKGVQDP